MKKKCNIEGLPPNISLTDLLLIKGGRSLTIKCGELKSAGVTESDICKIRSTAIVICGGNGGTGVTSDNEIDSIPDSIINSEVVQVAGDSINNRDNVCEILACHHLKEKAMEVLGITKKK